MADLVAVPPHHLGRSHPVSMAAVLQGSSFDLLTAQIERNTSDYLCGRRSVHHIALWRIERLCQHIIIVSPLKKQQSGSFDDIPCAQAAAMTPTALLLHTRLACSSVLDGH